MREFAAHDDECGECRAIRGGTLLCDRHRYVILVKGDPTILEVTALPTPDEAMNGTGNVVLLRNALYVDLAGGWLRVGRIVMGVEGTDDLPANWRR